MHSNWRNCDAWRAEGLPLSSPSNEACKLFDGALSQFTGWYEDSNLGGLKSTLKKMIQSDPDFVMGRALSCGLSLAGATENCRVNPTLQDDISALLKLKLKQTSVLTEREKMHVHAINLWANEDLIGARKIFDSILLDHPTDMLALKHSFTISFLLGHDYPMRDCVSRVLPLWKPSLPLYSYLYGLLAYGLEETSLYAKAEKAAKKALELNPYDGFASHAFVHVLEMEGRTDEGVNFLQDKKADWLHSHHIAGHNYWHLALFNIEKGDFHSALEIFDKEVGPSSRNGSGLNLVDAASLLLRLKLEGIDTSKRWNEVFLNCKGKLDRHITLFYDAHYVMSSVGSKSNNETENYMKSLENFIATGKSSNHEFFLKVARDLCQGIIEYDQKNYEETVNLLFPMRYDFWKQGGASYAQNDIFNLILINAALQSGNDCHKKLAKQLIFERKATKEKSFLNDRLLSRV